MNKIIKIILAILGGCSVVIDIITPLAIALFWGYFFNLSILYSNIILVIGGLGSLFRAINVGWLK